MSDLYVSTNKIDTTVKNSIKLQAQFSKISAQFTLNSIDFIMFLRVIFLNFTETYRGIGIMLQLLFRRS